MAPAPTRIVKFNLLALTGFGNEALKALAGRGDVRVVALYTRQERGKFPYYEEENILDLAGRLGIPARTVPGKGDWSIEEEADVNLSVTFHRILRKNHLGRGRFNINIHPSLLPSYKGPTPTNWMIANKEKLCGLTAHMMTEGIDDGALIFQKAYPLEAATDPLLRKFLAGKVAEAVEAVLEDYPNFKEIRSPYPESAQPNFNAPPPR